MAGGFLEESAAAQCMRNAALSGNEKSLVSARIQGALALAAAAKQMRRLFGYRGSAARQDVLVAADADVSSWDENEHAAWLAHRKAKNDGRKDFARKEDFARNEENAGKKGKKGRSDGSTLNGCNRRTGGPQSVLQV